MGERFAAADLTVGQINAVIKALGGHDAALQLLRGELSVYKKPALYKKSTRNWRKKSGVIYLSVISDGTNGLEWERRLEAKGSIVSLGASRALESKDFNPTKGIRFEVAVLTVGLFENKDLTTVNIRSEAANRGLVTPNAEIACLVRENFTNKQIKAMGLTGICVMHSPLTSWTGDVPLLLGTDTLNDKSFLVSLPDKPQFKWNSGAGFAFVVP